MGLAILTFGGGERSRLFFSSHLFAVAFTLSVLKTLVLDSHCTDRLSFLSQKQSLEEGCGI